MGRQQEKLKRYEKGSPAFNRGHRPSSAVMPRTSSVCRKRLRSPDTSHEGQTKKPKPSTKACAGKSKTIRCADADEEGEESTSVEMEKLSDEEEEDQEEVDSSAAEEGDGDAASHGEDSSLGSCQSVACE